MAWLRMDRHGVVNSTVSPHDTLTSALCSSLSNRSTILL